MHEFSRILTSAGVVAASVGVIIYGIAASYFNPGTYDLEIGRWMMVIGVIATLIGVVLYRRSWLEPHDD